ncbi:MAG TPA: UxaA family hydrolase [Limnochordia bacterium]|jgi:altronate dehydratase small subunit|nr:UxaA family hydrolase [Limnochordia bacterium]
MNRVLVLDEAVDNVGTAITAIPKGAVITARMGEGEVSFPAVDDIPAGHKVALRTIAQGQPVVKYGCSIGQAVQEIAQGQHVHVHNVRSMRGKELLQGGTEQ